MTCKRGSEELCGWNKADKRTVPSIQANCLMSRVHNALPKLLQRGLPLVFAALIVKVTVAVVLNYRNYLPPNFASDFLQGRESYFFYSYQWAFYPHIASGPIALLLGLLLVNDSFRMKFPAWHRWFGRVQTACVLLVVVPSGCWMAAYSAPGKLAGLGFFSLSALTAICSIMGWRTAMQRRFHAHRRWMWRSFVLLCSAVVLRVLGGLGTVLEIRWLWFDTVASWASWLGPLTIFETHHWRRAHRATSQPTSRPY